MTTNKNPDTDDENPPPSPKPLPSPPSLIPTVTTNKNVNDNQVRNVVESMPPDEEEEEDLVNTNEKETGDDEESPTTKPSPADTENNNMDGIIKQQKQKNKTKKKKQPPPPPVMNPKFKDVQETGAWGEIGKREVYVAVGVFVTIVIVAIAVVLAIVLPGSSSSSDEDVVTVEERTVRTLENVRAEISSNDVTAPLVEGLPDDPAFYKQLLDEGESSTGGGTPQQQAMAWLLFVDEPRDQQGRQATVRWALASMYYQLGGPEWVSSEGWLEPIPVCDWEHLVCDTRGVLQQVDMGELNLVGDIPLEIALLGENIQSISFKRNGLTGEIPADVFASLPRLGMLYLDHNDLTGTVPASLGTLCKYTFSNRFVYGFVFVCVCVCGKFRRN
jgi:hypothetical protein